VKPAPFDYAVATSVPDALALLSRDDARALAGGQSLVPLMNFRFARPALLVDINPVGELAHLGVDGAGALRIGALARQSALERSPLVAGRWPLLREAVGHVAHPAIRNRGTVGGSVAHADPHAELPVALAALAARFHVRSAHGERVLSAEELFIGPFMTALEEGELLTEIEVPAPAPGSRMAFVEHARTHGDFALAGAAVVLTPGVQASVWMLGAGSGPVRAPAGAETALCDGASAAQVGGLAASEVGEDHRRALVAAMVRRAVDGARA
jgi:CO/xanthine dehydrogenase FAD-binding subunit